jgi:hypothetical protein
VYFLNELIVVYLDSHDPGGQTQLPKDIEGVPAKFVFSGPFRQLAGEGVRQTCLERTSLGMSRKHRKTAALNAKKPDLVSGNLVQA